MVGEAESSATSSVNVCGICMHVVGKPALSRVKYLAFLHFCWLLLKRQPCTRILEIFKHTELCPQFFSLGYTISQYMGGFLGPQMAQSHSSEQ